MPRQPKGVRYGGRKKGTPNKSTTEIGALCRGWIEHPDYRQKLQQRLYDGTLPPALEALVFHYAYGKPVERHEHSGPAGGPIQVHDHFALPS